MSAPEAATFSEAWLALREPADLRARSATLEETLARCLRRHPAQRIVDLGAGSGSNLRALAPRLGPRQHWTLVDHDDLLAEAARARLVAFADAARTEGDALVLTLGPREIRVDFAMADLAADPGAALAFGAHLVTAAAFYDLVSADWCASFARRLAGSGIVVHAALTCDGRDSWHPPHSADAAIAAAFRAHQGMDKGFGPAAGAEAGAVLAAALERSGYAATCADSPWRLGPQDHALIAELARGTAGAAAESGRVDRTVAQDWARARSAAEACVIGHMDLLAVPAGFGA